MPDKEELFDVWQKKYAEYHQDGNVKKVEFNQILNHGVTSGEQAVNLYQYYDGYMRGIPQLVKVPNRLAAGEMQLSRSVDENGWIESVTDFNGHTTEYEYDKIGRIKSIDSPGTKWLDTVFTWSFDADLQPVRTTERCTLDKTTHTCSDTAAFTTTTTYDGLLRATLIEQSDGTNSVYQNSRFNADNQVTFQSYPSSSITEASGISYSYDALQRQETISFSGGGTITNEYLTGNKIKVTDAGKNAENTQNSTTTTYLAYGEPSYEQAIMIESPESVATSIDINLFGNIKSITQSGLNGISQTEYRAYDAQQRLCQIVRNDVGTTVFKRNALGQIAWQAQGQSATSNTVCNTTASAADKIEYGYDNLGSRHTVDYKGDEAIERTYTLDKNGNIKTIVGQGYSQSYNYNELGLLEDESLTISGRAAGALRLDYTYSKLGHLSAIKYPGDLPAVGFSPNGFGQATQAIRSYPPAPVQQLDTFVKGGEDKAQYHPNGVVHSFTYGNGLKHVTDLDSANRPKLINDYAEVSGRGNDNKVSLAYVFDNNNNIISLSNHVEPNYSLTNLVYDGLDRLTSTAGNNAGSGSSTISYDGLGNIRTYSNSSEVDAYGFEHMSLSYTYDETGDSPSYKLLKVENGTGDSASLVRDFSADDSYDSRGNVKLMAIPKVLAALSITLKIKWSAHEAIVIYTMVMVVVFEVKSQALPNIVCTVNQVS